MDWFLYDNGLRHKELNNYNVTNSKCKKILAIKIDHKLTFNTHLEKIYKKMMKNRISYQRLYLTLTSQTDVAGKCVLPVSI